jgi:membrane-anchored glycerophosphoryl diester phosphodiesterase (GDPDase)
MRKVIDELVWLKDMVFPFYSIILYIFIYIFLMCQIFIGSYKSVVLQSILIVEALIKHIQAWTGFWFSGALLSIIYNYNRRRKKKKENELNE